MRRCRICGQPAPLRGYVTINEQIPGFVKLRFRREVLQICSNRCMFRVRLLAKA